MKDVINSYAHVIHLIDTHINSKCPNRWNIQIVPWTDGVSKEIKNGFSFQLQDEIKYMTGDRSKGLYFVSQKVVTNKSTLLHKQRLKRTFVCLKVRTEKRKIKWVQFSYN